MLRGVLVVALIGCSSSTTRPASPQPSPAPKCLADELAALRSPERVDRSCTKTSCKQACDDGNADGCMMHGYSLQSAEAHSEAHQRFARACKLGLAIGCTNYGAALWSPEPPNAENACAKRLFDKACEVREPWGCGMVGRMLAEDAKTDEQRTDARLYFERTCHDLGNITCRMYAVYIERDVLGPPDPERVKDLLRRACDTGDEGACGHETALESFQ